MRSRIQHQTLSKITEIEIGLEESAVVQVEAGEAKGYLISEAYTVGKLPSEITLTNVTYLCSHGHDIQIAQAPEVLVSHKDDCWFAVEMGKVSLIPCPAKAPYPILFISKHGFDWMADTIQNGHIKKLTKHLDDRFQSHNFTTSRSILKELSSPFHRASRMETKSFHDIGS